MAKEKPEAEYEPFSFKKVQELLAPLGDEAFTAKHARALLSKAGDKMPGRSLRPFASAGGMRGIGNMHDLEPIREGDTPGRPVPNNEFRFKLTLPLPGGKFWLRPIEGYGAGLDVAGIRLDRFGKLVEITSVTRLVLESQDCPVEVITGQEEIAKLTALAKERIKASGKVLDKQAAVMDSLDD